MIYESYLSIYALSLVWLFVPTDAETVVIEAIGFWVLLFAVWQQVAVFVLEYVCLPFYEVFFVFRTKVFERRSADLSRVEIFKR